MTATATKQTIVHEGIGASEAPAALGMDPFKPPIVLLQEKRGELPSFDGNDYSDWGVQSEPAIRNYYAEKTGTTIHVPPTSLFHPDMPWVRATPDGIIMDGDVPRYGLECKNRNWRQEHRWGEPGGDDIPPETLIQCVQGMAVTKLPRWDVAVSIGGAPPVFYTIHRDMDLEAMVLEGVTRFWHDHVLTGIPPEVDATEEYRRYLAAKNPKLRQEYVVADLEGDELLGRLRGLRRQVADLEQERDLVLNQVCARIGDARGIESKEHGRLTWSWRKGSPSWKSVATKLAARAGVGAVELDGMAEESRGESSRVPYYPRSWSK